MQFWSIASVLTQEKDISWVTYVVFSKFEQFEEGKSPPCLLCGLDPPQGIVEVSMVPLRAVVSPGVRA